MYTLRRRGLGWVSRAAVMSAVAALAVVVPAGAAAARYSEHTENSGGHAWSQFHANAAHTGWIRDGRAPSADSAGRLTRTWTAADGSLAGSPVIDGDTVYAATAFTDRAGVTTWSLIAVRRGTGRTVWRAPLTGGPQMPPAALAVAGGQILLVDGDRLVSRRAGSGRLAWSRAVGGSRGPTVSGDTAYVGSADGHVYALAVGNGSVRWTATVPGEVNSLLAVADGRVYAAAGERLYVLDARSGRAVWNAPVGTVYGGGAAVEHGVVYVGANTAGSEGGARLSALRARDGRLLWTVPAGDDVHSVPAVDAGSVYLGTIDGHVRAFSASGGRLRWDTEVDGEVWSAVALVNDVAYLTTDTGTTFALDTRNGSVRWSDLPPVPQSSASQSSAAMDRGVLYVGYGNAGLRAYGLRR